MTVRELKSLGACRGMPTRLFYPERGESSAPAKLVCWEDCTIRKECLEYSLDHEHFGVWGGISERQRRTMRRTLPVTIIEYKIEAVARTEEVMALAGE